MEKVTQKSVREYLKLKLSTDESWATRALIKIYEHQTEEEKRLEQTQHWNGIGFNAFDANILSGIATFYLKTNKLTAKQKEIVFKKIPRYWKQVEQISNKNILHNNIKKHLTSLHT